MSDLRCQGQIRIGNWKSGGQRAEDCCLGKSFYGTDVIVVNKNFPWRFWLILSHGMENQE